MRARLAVAALAVLAVAIVATARETSMGRSEMEAADGAAAASDWVDAIAHARAAAEAVAPGSPWPERGRTRLDAIGREAEGRGDETTALLAYGALRAAALATRLPGWSSSAWRQKADEGIARVAAAHADRSNAAPTIEATRDALRGNEPPSPMHLALLGAGALCALIGLAFVLLSR
jgi:hypothetical protein